MRLHSLLLLLALLTTRNYQWLLLLLMRIVLVKVLARLLAERSIAAVAARASKGVAIHLLVHLLVI